jgi:hypothetical protein
MTRHNSRHQPVALWVAMAVALAVHQFMVIDLKPVLTEI